MHVAIVYYLNVIYWQVIFFKLLYLEQITLKYSERLFLCMNNYHYRLNLKFNKLFHSLNVIECTLGCQYISVTLYLLQTYPSGNKNLLKTTVGCFFMVGGGEGLGRGGLSKNNVKIQNLIFEVLF